MHIESRLVIASDEDEVQSGLQGHGEEKHTFSVIKRDNSTLDPYPRQNFTINNKNSLFILKPDILSLTVIPNPRQFLNCLVTMDEDCDLITDDLKDSMVHSNYLR